MTQKVIKFESLDSTNNYVAKALEIGDYTEHDVILAGFQTEGRGQRGNIWQSDLNKNLTFSFAFAIDFLHFEEHFIISKAVSVGIAQYLEEKMGMPVNLKWPNDILIENQKICGILLESKIIDKNRYIIVGIGLNMNQTAFITDYAATSLSLEMGQTLDLDREIKLLLSYLKKYIQMVQSRAFEPIEDAYLSRLLGTREFIAIKDANRKYQGKVIYVSNSGEISIKSRQGYIETYRTGEVKISL